MISRRTIINLIVFLIISAGLVVLGFVQLLGNPAQQATTVSAVFPDASGLHSNFSVTYDGVDVGSVKSVKLAPGGARVKIAIDPGVTVPSNVVATINLANALGEQEINLRPGSGSAPPLRNGQTLKVDQNGVPASIGELVNVADRLLNAIPAGALNNVLHEAAVALKGRGQDLRTITEASIAFDQEFLRYQNQFKALLANSPPVMNAVSAVGPQLQDALANTAVLTQVLANRRYDLATAIQQGAPLASDLQSLLSSSLPNLACLTHDFADLATNLNQPANLANLDYGLKNNNNFFGAINQVSPQGLAKPLYPGDPGSATQPWLRVRLLVPPKQPSPTPYTTPNQLPVTKPGAGCSTELGQGVGPATQAHPSPPGPGGRVVPPPASESQVRGGGPTLTQPAVYRTSAGSAPAGVSTPSVLVMLVAGLAVVGSGMAAGRARTRRPVGDMRW